MEHMNKHAIITTQNCIWNKMEHISLKNPSINHNILFFPMYPSKKTKQKRKQTSLKLIKKTQPLGQVLGHISMNDPPNQPWCSPTSWHPSHLIQLKQQPLRRLMKYLEITTDQTKRHNPTNFTMEKKPVEILEMLRLVSKDFFKG